MADTYTPATAAQEIGVAPNTIRRWCNQHAAHLSDGATGAVRTLTNHDLTTLQYVASLRADGMQTEAINRRLTETEVQPGEIIAQDEPQTEPVEREEQDAMQVPVLMLQQHSETLQRLATRLEQQRSAEVKALAGEVSTLRTWLLVLAAIVLALVVAVVFLWVV